MAERKRSRDGRRETEEVLGDKTAIAQQGRAGGRIARQIGTKDELKRAYERPAGVTRVTKSVEEDDSGGRK